VKSKYQYKKLGGTKKMECIELKEEEIELLNRKAREENTCWMCGCTLKTVSRGTNGWETFCPNCGETYDED